MPQIKMQQECSSSNFQCFRRYPSYIRFVSDPLLALVELSSCVLEHTISNRTSRTEDREHTVTGARQTQTTGRHIDMHVSYDQPVIRNAKNNS